jgi:multiple sugar transport system permease protein
MGSFKSRTDKWIGTHFGKILLLPSLIVLLLLGVYPLLYSLGLSFVKWKLTGNLPISFVGIENYKEVFLTSSFLNSVRVTLTYTLIAVFIEFILGLGIALLLVRETKAAHFVRTIVIIPLSTAPIVTAILWRVMYDPSVGIINYILKSLGFQKVLFLSNVSRALPSVILVDVWMTTPFIIMVLLAALISLPEEFYEAAKVDGSNSWQTFRYITLPLLGPTIAIALLIRLMDAFKIFDIIYGMTRGGPAQTTNVMSMDIYYQTFRYFEMGIGSAYSWIMIAILGIIIFLFIRIASFITREKI